jgi:hypothetical protein
MRIARASWAIVALLVLGLLGQTSRAAILFEDIMYWRPGGITELNPSTPPLDAYVKIQETVYDDAQGRLVLGPQLAAGIIHGNGGLIPVFPINVYVYSITNLNYGNGPTTGSGAGIGGFKIPNPAGVPFVIYAPSRANDNWHEHAAGPDFEWQIDKNANTLDGDGLGIILGQTHNGIIFVVPAGRAHGFITGATINTWTGAGLLEEPVALKTDFITGFVSGPIPEPSVTAVLLLIAGAIGRRAGRSASAGRRAFRDDRDRADDGSSP